MVGVSWPRARFDCVLWPGQFLKTMSTGKCQSLSYMACSIPLVKLLSCFAAQFCPWSSFSPDTPWSNCETNVYLQWKQPTGYQVCIREHKLHAKAMSFLRGKAKPMLTFCLPTGLPWCLWAVSWAMCMLRVWMFFEMELDPQVYDFAYLLQVSYCLWGGGFPLISTLRQSKIPHA